MPHSIKEILHQAPPGMFLAHIGLSGAQIPTRLLSALVLADVCDSTFLNIESWNGSFLVSALEPSISIMMSLN